MRWSSRFYSYGLPYCYDRGNEWWRRRWRGGGAGTGGSGSATKGAIISATLANITPDTVDIDDHYLDVTIQDKEKLPVTGYRYTLKSPDGITNAGHLGGQIKKNSVAQGNYELKLFGIVNAQWSKQEAKVGETVTIKVETVGIENNTNASLQVFIKDSNYTDYLLKTFETTVNSDKIEQDYTLKVDEKLLGICDQKSTKKRYSQPFFYYKVNIGDLTEQSNLLLYKDYADIQVKDDDGKVIKDKKVKVYLPTGEIKEEKIDNKGKLKIKNIPPGNIKFTVDCN